MKCRQRMVAAAGFPDYDQIRTLLKCHFQSGSSRRTVIYNQDADQGVYLSYARLRLS